MSPPLCSMDLNHLQGIPMKTLLCTLVLAALGLFHSRAAMSDTLDDIQKRGELIVGMEIAYKPFEFFRDGQAVGFDVDMAQLIAKGLGVKLRTVDAAWAGIVPALLEKKFDVILSGMTITGDRLKKVNFSQPVALGSVVFLARMNDGKINRAEDLSGKVVATQLGSVGDRVARQFEVRLKDSGKPGYSAFKLYDGFAETYLELGLGRIDAVSGALPVFQSVIAERPGRYKIIDGIQDIESYLGMALRKGDDRLLKAVDEQITALKRSGQLLQLQIKWFGAAQQVPDAIPAQLP